MSEKGTVCPRDCYDTCFMKVQLDSTGKPVRTMGDKANPVTQGFLCPRGVADIKRAYSSERILYPHKRVGKKPQGAFTRITWDEALGILAQKIRRTIDEYGPEAALHLDYTGNMGLLTLHFAQRLFYALGFSQTDYGLCSKSGHKALALHYGLSYGIDPDELPDMKLTVYWGFNAAVSAPHLHALSLKARRKGGVIVAVDPRQSETAKAADFWVQPRPGGDVALAYGVMKYLIDKNLVDHAFIEGHTHGFDKLKEETAKWDAATIEQYTRLKNETIAKLAELYAERKPSATFIGFGMQKSLQGAEATRAVSLIPPLVGLHRAFYYSNSRGWNVNEPYLSGQTLTKKNVKVVSQVGLGRHLQNGEFKLVYVYIMNPACTLTNQTAVRNGLSRDDVFVVVHDTHWTETARHADLVLPAPTFLEKEDIVVSYSHRYVRKSPPVMEPLGESKTEWWVTTQLAKRLGATEEWLYEDPWVALGKAMSNAFENGDFADLQQGRVLKLRMMPKAEYQTPTGKLEFYSTASRESGFTPLPKQYPLAQSEQLVFLNNAVRNYTHTQFQDVYGPLPATVQINPDDAEKRGIRDGDAVELSNEFGSIKLKAIISEAVPRGVLWAARECNDLDGRPQNTIIPDTTQEIGGGPIFNSTAVNVKVSDNYESLFQLKTGCS